MLRDHISAYLNTVIQGLILAVVFFTPLIFSPLTTEFFNIPKILFLIFAISILLILWSLSWVISGKVLLTRTPLDLPLLLLIVIIVLSTIFTDSKYTAIFGQFPRVNGSAVTWIFYILFYFILTSHLKTLNQVKNLFYALLASTTLVSLVSLSSYLGLYLPFDFAKFIDFTPTGGAYSTGAMFVLIIPLLLLSVIGYHRFSLDDLKLNAPIIPPPAALVLLTFLGITLALTGNQTTQIIAVATVLITIWVAKRSEVKKSVYLMAIPILSTALVFTLNFFPNNNSNLLFAKRANFPSELQLPFITSWKVSASSFRDAPFLGTGPATYLFNFTQYKPIEYNLTTLWNLRFDQAFNEYLQTLGTLGGLGLLAFLFFTVMVLTMGVTGLRERDNILAQGLSISALVTIVLFALHTSTPVVMVAVLSLLAALMAIHKSVTGKVEELQLGIKASKLTDSNLIVGDILPIILFIPILAALAVVLFNTSKSALADYNHRQALKSASVRGIDTYNFLVKAENLNPYVDLYRTDLAQTNFALANAIATAKGPTESSAAGSLTDADKQDIQTLLSQSIREAQVATLLSARNAQNWEILGSIYRQISGVAQNALDFSINAYGRAIQQDPLNPLLRLNVGGIYYSVKNYDLALRFFSDAINLKPDYANAYYNLSVVLKDKGDLKGAQLAAEQVVRLVDPKTPDYKFASSYLADLKARIATQSSEQTQINQNQTVAPAGQESSALQKKELPKVLNLPKVENVATPPAVKKSSEQNQ